MSMTWDFILRLFVAGALGAVIGLDREYRAKEAGYRTHFLVSLGSALIMIVSQYGFMEIIKIAGSERYRFYRCRHYHFSEANSAWINNGCRYMGYLRYRTRSRSRNVLAGDFGYYSYFNRFGGIELSF